MSKRYEHFMFPTKDNRQPKLIVGVDCDGDRIVTKPGPAIEVERLTRWFCVSSVRVAGEYTDRREFEGTTAAEFWDLMARALRHYPTVHALSGNASRTFALLELWRMLEDERCYLSGYEPREEGEQPTASGGRRTGLLILDDPINVAQIRMPGCTGTCTFVGSGNYGLESADESERADGNARRWHRALLEFISALEANNMGSLQITTSAQSMFTFRHTFMHDTILCHAHKECMELEHAGYHGGRSEVYQLGEVSKRIHHVDFTSMYGYLSSTQYVPVRLIEYSAGWNAEKSWSNPFGSVGMAKVLVNVRLPCLPFARNGLTVYPTGRFWSTLCGPELAYAAGNGWVEQVAEHAFYEREPALKWYATYWLDKRSLCRKHGWKDLETFCKRMLVGLVGKFGQRGRSWEYVDHVEADHPFDAWKRMDEDHVTRRYRSVAWYVQREVESMWGPMAVPAMAAWITSAGRLRLWHAMQDAGISNIYAVETDGMFVNDCGLDGLHQAGWIQDATPGMMRHTETASGGVFYGYQCYRVGGITVASGVPHVERYDDAATRFGWIRTGLADSLRNHQTPQARRVLIRFGTDRRYRQGRVCDDGSVTPFELPADLNSIGDQ